MTTHKTTTRNGRLGITLAAMAGLTAGIAQANPQGGVIFNDDGSITINYNGDVLNIDMGSELYGIIDWASFDIDAHESVFFNMLSNSRVLNRIHSATPSQIMGSLTANGQVLIVNPAGVVFGQGAVVNVGSLYAAAGDISNMNFIVGNYRFTDLHGAVENYGHLEGSTIAMIGGYVANHGSIAAPNGTVIMAAGEQVLIGSHLGNRFVEIEVPVGGFIDSAALDNGTPDLAAGDIYSIAAWNNGVIISETVIVKTAGADASNSGTIAASGASGGSIEIGGDNVFLTSQPVLGTGVSVPLSGGIVTVNAGPGGVIDLGADISSTGAGIFLNGDVRLTVDATLTSTGAFSNTEINGNLYSELGEFNSLNVFAPNGDASFNGFVGVDATSDQRLSFLNVETYEAFFQNDVSTRDGMTILGHTGITGASVTFHTGLGSALFGGNIYSTVRGASDVAFMYDGEVWTGVGEGRTPFKFRGHIGTPPPLHAIPNQGAFRTITFGADVPGSIVASSFLFSNAAAEGLALMDGSILDLSSQFFVSATEGIYAGRGQKLLSMGDLYISAKGMGFTEVALSDVNVLGNLTIESRGRAGGTLTLLGHFGDYIHGTKNEGDRSGSGYDEKGAELIASGSISLFGTLLVDSVGATLGAESVILANNAGTGTPLGLDIITFPGGASLANFAGTQPGAMGMVYAYDLTLGDFIPPTPTNNLATSFVDEDIMELRDDPPYLAQRQVLIELTLPPQYIGDKVVRDGTSEGLETLKSNQAGWAKDNTAPLTLDRLSPRSVSRLTDAYVGLFGQRDANADYRPGVERVAQVLANGTQDEIDVVMSQIGLVLDRIALLELTPMEIEKAQGALLEMIRPDSADSNQFRSQWAMN